MAAVHLHESPAAHWWVMADESSDQEKTEAASPRRLEKAREEGQVARSRELTTFLLLLAGIAALWSMGGLLHERLAEVMEQALLFERAQAFDSARMLARFWELGEGTLFTLLPLFLLMAVVALVAPSLLGGLLVSAKALQPQLARLNPLKGLKRVFSTQALAELGKAVAKSILVGWIAVFFLRKYIDELMALSGMPIREALADAMRLMALASAMIVLGLILVVALDVPYQLWSHARKLRMSKEELRQEHKESEGDPHVKGRIRSQQQAMARSRMMSKVPTADVIVTNPTHYAVALSYRDGQMGAPRVVAKGADALAARIRELGGEHAVPLLEAAPLARALYYHVDLDREIPVELYTAVAEVLAWAYRLRQVREEGGEMPETPRDLPVPEGMDERGQSEESQTR
ncbi:flagellar biosynthetic protein [Azotobacter vinelandii CA]|uniref:Flagellar biosynthetic protein FlhB n=2 Tax=Azotobacter vinelandii TaxID=354 RepID=C1DKW2_AZOVD|nr:flagellar biosynthesis protein FlhB [Azotobacter vinelandii]ACO78964.1 flagellar biosynthetic protein [Azotobacter vinelandii DJ]AGK13485.1 flagellar biosynthetic protein [Azotobacter vinelandii CA]AGK17898.1 flagellar biosynthetic protein [Azotobacter vinelandii CA6]SFY12496.1 flagellar biosynthetic protein FlhB [Azotobacter vinelandii]GLK59719.1 flagellar biosynthesis protein FlhB [Azotobacter vinelandii]